MTESDHDHESINVTFQALVIADSNSGWPCIQMPNSAALFGTGKPVKVAAIVDGHSYEATMLPVGGGTHMMPLRAAFRKVLGKELGDLVTIQLTHRFN